MLYLGPEVVAPVLSALAAIGGVLLMFWRRVVASTRALLRLVTGKAGGDGSSEQDPIA
jgi:HAMP domain-containing protein